MNDHSNLLTVRDFLRHAVSRFRGAHLVHGHGTTSVIDEAAFLVLETLHLPVDDINPWLDARLTEEERASLAALIAARVATRKPAAYLVKKTYMHGVPFYVDERAIVPRSYIGDLLMKDIGALIDDPNSVETVLDLCTGSGCLAILAGMVFPRAEIVGADISREALEVATINVQQHEMGSRITLRPGNLFQPVQGRRFDLILANPPYVARAEVEAFPPEYAAEPLLAHFGGEDGLDIVRDIIEEAPRHMNPGGTLICEIGTGRDIIEREFNRLDLMWLDTEESEGEVFLLKAPPAGD